MSASEKGNRFAPPRAEERSQLVRTVHRTGSPGRRTRAGRGARSQAQLHRDRAHPARAAARGRRSRRACARVARHHRRGSACAGCAGSSARVTRSPPARSRSRLGRRRCSSWRCAKRCRSATTTSAPSTSCSGSCARTKASRRASCSTSTPTPRRSATRSSACSPAPAAGRAAPRVASGEKGKSSKLLDQFGRNLTKQAQEGKLDPVVGRQTEIERVMQILSRRTKNNPVLIGEPGVGKTAVVEGLASRISVEPGARPPEEQADLHARPRGARRRVEVPR